MNCKRCKSKRVLHVSAKCSDLCFVELGAAKHDGYVPDDLNIGGGDYVVFKVCLDCGQHQGKFPVAKSELEGSDES